MTVKTSDDVLLGLITRPRSDGHLLTLFRVSCYLCLEVSINSTDIPTVPVAHSLPCSTREEIVHNFVGFTFLVSA